MGIYRFNSWLNDNGFIKCLPAGSNLNIDTLYIDCTQIFYFIKNKNEEITTKEEFIEVFLEEIEKLIRKYEPKRILFMTMEGTSPVAKFQNQRKRRFKNANEEIQEFVIPNEETFNTMLTEKIFLGDADSSIKNLLSSIQKGEKLSDIKTKSFKYSGRFVPGEGEHKYFDFIRESRKSSTWQAGQKHAIISNDNDLIFLALQYTDEDFTIIKINDDNNESSFSIVEVSEVRNYLLRQIRNNIPRRSFKEERAMKDIIGLSFLLGNDFIPEFEDIGSNISNLNRLLSAYYAFNKKNNRYQYLIENDTFSVYNLCQILSIFFNKDVCANTNRNKYKVDPFEKQLKIKAQEVVRILNFTIIYYTQGLPSWTYYFPYEKSPRLQDVARFMHQEGKVFFDNLIDNEIPDHLLKLLITLPVQMIGGLPWPIYQIKIESKFAKKYWPVDNCMKVPIFNYAEIKKAYNEALIHLSEKDKRSNRLEKLVILEI